MFFSVIVVAMAVSGSPVPVGPLSSSAEVISAIVIEVEPVEFFVTAPGNPDQPEVASNE